MKIIESNVKEVVQEPGLEGIYKQIAYGGRICYMSEKVGEHKEFVDRLIERKHGSPLEHGTVYLKFVVDIRFPDNVEIEFFNQNPWSKINFVADGDFHDICFVTTNYRVLVENDKLYMLDYLCEPTEYHKKRRSFRVVTSIGITREFNRHKFK